MLLDLAARLRRFVLRTTGWRTRGVRVLVFDRTGRLLLVRHGYGARETWHAPGGAVRWREEPAAAARREVREEAGCALTALQPAGVFDHRAEGWRDTVYLFRAVTEAAPRASGWEVVEARFFAPDALPAGTSGPILRRLNEMEGAPVSPTW